MNRRRYYDDDIRDIRTMEDLRYHKMRLELSNDFLEEKLEDNLKGLKRQLSPKYLFRTIVTTVATMVGRSIGKKHMHSETNNTDEGPDTVSVFLAGFTALLKAIFRSA